MGDPRAGEGDPDLDLGRWLLRSFGGRDLTYPYVPPFAIPALHLQPPSTATTSEVDSTELYLFHHAADTLLNGRVDSRYAVSFWGHGINSYAWTVLLQRPGLRLLAQVGFGGAFGDAEEEASSLDDLFSTVRDIDAEVPEGIRRDLVVLMSDLRDIRCTGWASRDPVELHSWLEQAFPSHPLLVLDDLVRRSDSWPKRPEAPLRFADRAERMAHEAQVAYEWSTRYPEAADGATDPAADLALALAMERWPELPAPHRWLPASLADPACWWCFGDQSDQLHR